VSEDELEGDYRQILNFGHTLGHALEAASDYGLGHGSAVAVGMRLEAEIGERMGITEPGTRLRLDGALSAVVGAEAPPVDPESALRYLRADKKARAGRPRIVLLRRIGEVDRGTDWSHEVSEQLLAEVLTEGVVNA
jgi:3-dehydroquinate synthase